MLIRCFWPPLRFTPRSPKRVSYLFVKPSISSETPADSAAFLIISRLAFSRPNAMLFAIVSEKRNTS